MNSEGLAVHEFGLRISRTDYLKDYINMNDKEPIWDGAVYVYNDKKKSNEGFNSRVPVQIKGRKVKKLQKDTIKFNISHKEMKSYRDEGGCIYVVYHYDNEGNSKMYITKLLPFMINRLIDIFLKRPNVTFELKLIPDDIKKLEGIFFIFIAERKKQKLSEDGHNWTVEEIIKKYGKDNWKYGFSYSSLGYDRNDPFSYLKENDVYLHMFNEDNGMFFTVEHIQQTDVFSETVNVRISNDDTVFYDHVTVNKYRDGNTKIQIGASCSLTIKTGELSRFDYHLSGNLDDRIKDLSFMISVYRNDGFGVNNGFLKLNSSDKELSKFDINKESLSLEYMTDVKNMLDILRVKKSLDVEGISGNEENHIRSLVNAVVLGNSIRYDEKPPHVATIEFSNIRLILVFNKNENGSYSISNFFDEKLRFTVDEGGLYETSQYTIFSKNDYKTISNMDYEVLTESFKEYNNQYHLERVVASVLNMLLAFDETNNIDLLNAALKICHWLCSLDGEYYVYKLNLFQCIKRQRQLTSEEYKELNDIGREDKDNLELQFGTQTLLGNKQLADIYFNSIPEDSRKKVEEYPIYNLYKKMN